MNKRSLYLSLLVFLFCILSSHASGQSLPVGQADITVEDFPERTILGSMRLPLFKGMGLSRETYVKYVTEEVIQGMAGRNYENFNCFVRNVPLLDEEISVIFLPASREITKAARADYLNVMGRTDRGKSLSRLGQALKTQKVLEERAEAMKPRTPQPIPEKDAEAEPDISFPDDEGLHVSKLIEWWYYTGHFQSDENRNFGFELCFFRFTPFIYFAHAAITDIDGGKIHYIRRIFPATSVSVKRGELDLTYGGWGSKAIGSFTYDIWAETPEFSFQFLLRSLKPPMLIGDSGIIEMGVDRPSYYYSLTRNAASGTITLNGEDYQVSGTGWMDHQWGNFFMSCIWGWDWFSLQLENNMELNIFSFKDSQGEQTNPFVEILHPDNTNELLRQVELTPLSWWRSPTTNIKYPSGFHIFLPDKNYHFDVIPKLKEQEIPANRFSPDFIDYWEGACSVSGKLDGVEVEGKAYNELCGYKKD